MKTLFNSFFSGTPRLRTWALSLLILIIVAVVPSCKPKFYEAPKPEVASGGSVDLTKYVAVGATMSSGFADNSLYTEGQDNSYPNLIARKIKEVNSSLVFVNAPTFSKFNA